jgi:hypothetical protein
LGKSGYKAKNTERVSCMIRATFISYCITKMADDQKDLKDFTSNKLREKGIISSPTETNT